MKRLLLALLLAAPYAYANDASQAPQAAPMTPPPAAERYGGRSIDMTTVLHDLKGAPIPDTTQATRDDPTCAKCSSLTLGAVVAAALLNDHPGETNLSSTDKAKRGALAMHIYDSKSVALTASQISMLIPLLSIWPPLISAQAIPLLDPNIDLTK